MSADLRHYLTRRRLIQLAAASTASPLLPSFAAPAAAQTVDLAWFLRMSADVTGHADLDPVLGQAILSTFDELGVTDAIAGLEATQDSPARRTLMRAWYLGKIAPSGEGRDDHLERQRAEGQDDEETNEKEAPDLVVGYEASLMGRVVDDLIPLRSYCGGPPHFWTEPPAERDILQNGGVE